MWWLRVRQIRINRRNLWEGQFCGCKFESCRRVLANLTYWCVALKKGTGVQDCKKNKAAYLHVGRNSKIPVFVEKFCGDHTATESILLPSCGRPCQVGKWCASLPSYLLSLSRTLAGYPHLKYNRSRAGGNDRCLDVFTALFSWWFNIRSLRITEFHRNDNLAMISDHDSDSGCLSFTSSFWPKRRKVK